MAKFVTIQNIKRALSIEPNQSVSYLLSGRVINFRPYKKFNFVDIIDGSTNKHLQAVISRDILVKPELGSYITCIGSILKSKGSQQEIEFKVEKIKYLGDCNPDDYPLSMSELLPRKLVHLKPRIPNFASLLRVRSELELSLHMIMKQMNFFRAHTPSLTSNDSEASSDLFVVKRTKVHNKSAQQDLQKDDSDSDSDSIVERLTNDCTTIKKENDDDDNSTSRNPLNDNQTKRIIRDDYFTKDVFLVTSAQLHLENLAASLSKVYTLSTAFRAENSLTTRHLCEFLMFEAEEANLFELEPLMNRVETIIKFMAQYLADISEYKSDFNDLICKNSNNDTYTKLAHSPYIRMHYSEALKVLKDKTNFSGNTDYGCDIGRTQERHLLDYCNNVPIFITNYPKQLKPFYMKCDDDNKEASCFDLIAPHGGEICGGSLREDSIEKLSVNLNNHQAKINAMQTGLQDDNENLKNFDWYLDSRRFGSFPHGGFGIGIERLLQSLLGIKNIRETTAFPRWAGHCPM